MVYQSDTSLMGRGCGETLGRRLGLKKLSILAALIALVVIACIREPAQGEGMLTDAPAEVAPPPSDPAVRDNAGTPQGENQTAPRDRVQSENGASPQERTDS